MQARRRHKNAVSAGAPWRSSYIGNNRARFLRDKTRAEQVPVVNAILPEGIYAPARDIGDLPRGRSEVPDSSGHQEHVAEGATCTIDVSRLLRHKGRLTRRSQCDSEFSLL